MIRERNLDALLRGNGNIIDAARRKGKSLDRAERSIILRVRAKAFAQGFTRTLVNAFEMEGEQGMRGTAPEPLEALFIGNQEIGLLGWSVRLYNIVGDHPLNNSTVTSLTLFRNGVTPLDIPVCAFWGEMIKEAVLLTYSTALELRWWVQNKFGGRP